MHIDCFYLPKINGVRWYVYLAIDRATRLLFLRIYPKKDKYSAYPFRIYTILTDNGREFTNLNQRSYGRTGKNPVPFELICELSGVDYRKTKFKHPWTNSMTERVIREIKEHTIKLERYQSLEEMAIGIIHYQDIHNFQCRLKTLGYRTPYQATMDWFIKEQKFFLKHPNELLTIR